MGEALDTNKIEGALGIANHPFHSFSFTEKQVKDGAEHYNFHGRFTPTEPIAGEKLNQSFISYTVIVSEKTGSVFLKKTGSDFDGKVEQKDRDKLVGTFASVAEFNKALDKATATDVFEGVEYPPMIGTARETLHNAESGAKDTKDNKAILVKPALDAPFIDPSKELQKPQAPQTEGKQY